MLVSVSSLIYRRSKELMKTKHTLLAVTLIAIVLTLALASVATAAGPPMPGVSGGVGFVNTDGFKSFASFNAKATGPAMAGADHQPARGSLKYSDDSGLTFTVAIEHIHQHSATEVHFGGTIVQASDPLLVGRFAHMVAIDGGSSGKKGDQFSILLSALATHEPGVLRPVTSGNLVVKTS
jgi:hypothetical protein